MKIFVTGGNGFIGRAFCEEAQSHDWDVFVVDKNAPISVDIGNGTALNNMMAKCQPNWVVHLAATPGVARGKDNVGAEAFQDLFNTRNVLQAMQLTGCKRILFVSTGSVYNTDQFPTPETATVGPTAFYAAGKLAAEAWIRAWCNAQGGTGVVLRLGTVIGAGNAKGLIFDFVRKLKQNPSQIEIWGDGYQEKSYVDIGHVARFMATSVKRIADGGYNVFNVGGPKSDSVRTVLSIVADEMGVQPAITAKLDAPTFGDVRKIDLALIHKIDLSLTRSAAVDGYPGLTAQSIRANVRWLLEHPEVFG